jgi:hypothetical protein
MVSQDTHGLIELIELVDSGVVLDAARGAVRSYRSSFDGSDNDVVRLPEAAAVELLRRLTTTISEGSKVKQIIPFTPSREASPYAAGAARTRHFAPQLRRTDEFGHAVARILAETRRTVERLYLVPPGGFPGKVVENRLQRDRVSGMAARWVRGTDLPAWSGGAAGRSLTSGPMTNMWIVDDKVVLFQEPAAAGPSVWTVTSRHRDVHEAGLFWSRLWQRAEQERLTGTDDDLDLTDPLLLSAEQIAAAAPMTCVEHNGILEHCDWYHGVWQYLRLFNMVPSPRWHHRFYLESLREALADRHRKVLIAGAADYSVLAYVFYTLRAAAPREQPAVDIADLCATPLNACRWYANRTGNPVRVIQTDFCDPKPKLLRQRNYDLIVADSLLNGFSLEKSRLLLRGWHRILAPGGQIITTVRLHSADRPFEGVFDEVSDFAARARDCARQWRPYLRVSVDDIAADARIYAQRITSVDLGDREALVNLFEENGFDVNSATVADVSAEVCQTQYLRIVAAKRHGVPEVGGTQRN